MTPEEVYMRLGELIASMPDLRAGLPLPSDTQLWLGGAAALAERLLDADDREELKQAANLLVASPDKFIADPATHVVTALLYRALAIA